MNEKEQLDWKINVVREIKEELLARGASSIRGTLDRRMYNLKLERIALDLPAQDEAVEG